MWREAKNFYHFLMALTAAFFYHFPSKDIKVIGVTGTDGKTTTVHMIARILEESGYKTSYISSLHGAIGAKIIKTGFHVTTPSSWQIQRLLRQAVSARHDFFVLEATSHGLDQHRLSFINFEAAVLTNITHEHLDYHKTWEKYALAKLKLFKNAKEKILNIDDGSFKFLSKNIEGDFTTYGLGNNADVNAKNFHLSLKVIGSYNLHNALAAVALAQKIGIPKSKIIKALNNFQSPEGRMQNLDFGQDFKVYIDFAHTPNALEKALHALKKEKTKNRKIISVFGAAGERDKSKRPLMGKIADQNSEVIILTAEDPRGESVEEICREISIGIKAKKLKSTLFVIPRRDEAIEFAINLAGKGDIVSLFGKGHEKVMTYKKDEIPWNEFETAKKAILARRLNVKE